MITRCARHLTAAFAGSVMAALTAIAALTALMVIGWPVDSAGAQSSVRPPAGASLPATPSNSSTPGNRPAAGLPAGFKSPAGSSTRRRMFIPPATDPTAGKGAIYDSGMWAVVKNGMRGKVSIPDKNSGVLMQTDGAQWVEFRNRSLPRYAGWALGGTLAFLTLALLFFGRIKIERGWAGRTIRRFGEFERMAHWLLAVSFIVLALTGLNVVYGKGLLLPLIGKSAFAALSAYAKLLHNFVAFAFMVGLVLTFVIWVIHNFPNRHDVVWLLKGGGMFSRTSHPPAKKFNAGQKILFWLVMISGVSISLSGLAMMFPFQVPLFAKTFAILNMAGAGLPAVLTPMQEMQYASSWHAILAIGMTCLIMAHIYIGTIGMQGAFSAMGTGDVDLNWAKEHHSVWVEEVLAREGHGGAPHVATGGKQGAGMQPAE